MKKKLTVDEASPAHIEEFIKFINNYYDRNPEVMSIHGYKG
jgi:hypothetical protein